MINERANDDDWIEIHKVAFNNCISIVFRKNNFTGLNLRGEDRSMAKIELVSKRREMLKYTKGLSDRLAFYSPHDPLADLLSSEYVERVTKETVYRFSKLYSSS